MVEEMLIGIDVGTTAVKATLFDMAGNQLETYGEAYPTNRSSHDVVEQDPDVWVDIIQKAVASFAALRNLSALKAIGICSQVNTHVFVDEAGNALAPAMVWQDGRCSVAAAQLDAQISDEDRMKWWGAPLPIDASHCLSRMKWMSEHHSEIWENTRYVMLPKDYCILKMTGETISDPISNIGLVGADLEYISELLALVPGAADRLPSLGKITDIAGTIRNHMSCAGTPVCVGTMDAWAGMFGVGVHNSGQAMYLSGTSEILGVISPKIVPTPGVLVFPKYDEMTVHAGPTQSGGASVKWYCELFDTTPQMMARSVEGLDPGHSSLLFLPHLQGERAPLWDINSRGTFLGIDSRTGPAEFARAVYEGVAYSVRMLLESLEHSANCHFDILNCAGGGFQSDIWNQIRADILGRRLNRLVVSAPGVVGAAGLAAVSVGQYPDIQTALENIVKFDRVYEPRTQYQDRYALIYDQYRKTYAATRDINKSLVELANLPGK